MNTDTIVYKSHTKRNDKFTYVTCDLDWKNILDTLL